MLRGMSTRKPHRGNSRKHSPSQISDWLYGHHAVIAALSNPKRAVERVAVLAGTGDNILPHIPKNCRMEKVDKGFFDKTFGRDRVHQGVAVLVKPLPSPALEDTLATSTGPLLLLDQITDPHNVGAILRSAAAFGASAIICPKDHAPAEGATLAKAASGALEVVPVIKITNLVKTIGIIKKSGYWVAGLDGEAKQTIGEAKLEAKTALVLGAEGKGMRRLTAEHCDLLVRLPISDKIESLNVSNAAAVALYALAQ